ncbi:MAG TPA: class I SAM-dependent methyltransferase [Hydrogenophaga sp.]|uniref:class I SAM-dependent methyltransferase n=1 Tax=Hydrogenophaga sp. TaxID=1904254 RepID=UPI002BE28E19|nr:class I SAM-dependent methyltransferase [Hydrogenophaga sp.]HMN93203.1 class I SAM-dependent methyltransferase [Hydrogenophaga sp.]
MHGTEAPSDWVQRWSHLVAPGGRVLDVACGHGRHMRWFAGRGHPVTGIDRSPEAIAAVAPLGRAIEADIENGPWPLPGERFDAVVVTNYLWRPLWPTLLDSLASGGVLLWETFSVDHATVGRPSRPEFLLRHGELLALCQDLRVVAYENGFALQPERFIQRVVAVLAPGTGDATPPRFLLDGPGDGARMPVGDH